MRDTRDDIIVELTNNGRSQYPLMLTGESDDDGNLCAAALVFDGDVRGIYTGNAMVDLAREYGWPEAPPFIEPGGFLTGGLYEVAEVYDAALNFLNTLVPDGYSFGWCEGNFYLANKAWWSLVNA